MVDFLDFFFCFLFESRSYWQTAVLVDVNVLDRLAQQCHSLDMTEGRDQNDGPDVMENVWGLGKIWKNNKVGKAFQDECNVYNIVCNTH